jgi:hypothetical protein
LLAICGAAAHCQDDKTYYYLETHLTSPLNIDGTVVQSSSHFSGRMNLLGGAANLQHVSGLAKQISVSLEQFL